MSNAGAVFDDGVELAEDDADPFDPATGPPPDPVILAASMEDLAGLMLRSTGAAFSNDRLYVAAQRLTQAGEYMIALADRHRARTGAAIAGQPQP